MSDTDSDCMVLDEEESDFGYGSSDYDEENVAPVVVKRKAAAPKPKRAAAPKKKATAVDDDNDSVSTNVLSPTKSNAEAGKKEKTIEEIYQKKSQIEHILIRPDTYGELVDSS